MSEKLKKSCRLSKSSVCIDKQAVMNFKRINDSKVIFFFTLCSHADEMNGLMEHQHCPEKTSESGAVIRTRNSPKFSTNAYMCPCWLNLNCNRISQG